MAGIDRDYWLDFAKDGISKSIESREKAAEKLDTFLGWTWIVYTSTFALGSLLNFVSSNVWQLVWLAQPVLIIMLARYYCAVVSMPSTNNDDSVRADPNEVASIIDSFKVIVEDKKKKLSVAKYLTFISIFSITAALIGYNYCDPDKVLKNEIQRAKLRKELSNQYLEESKKQQILNDSIKLINDFYDIQMKNTIKRRKLDCLTTGDTICVDRLTLIDK